MSDALPLHVTSADGTQVGFWRSGSGPAVVAVHGTTADHTRWAGIAARLEEVFTLHAMDRRGRGASGDTAPYSIRREAEDIAAVVRAAGQRVTLLGHSYGALCSLEAALELPALHRLILYEPPLPLAPALLPPAVRDELQRRIDAGDREGALVCFFREVVNVTDAELTLLRSHPAWPARIAAAHTIVREADAEEAYRLDVARPGRLSVPTLLLLGGDSPAPFREATRMLHAAIPGSRIHELRGQQHIAMDTAPTEFVDAIVAFALSGSAGSEIIV